MKSFYKILFTIIFSVGLLAFGYASNDGVFADQKIRFIQCYPNPASTSINFEFNIAVDKTFILSVYNFIGKKVDEVKISSGKINLNLENYYRGLYVYQLRDKQGQLIESGKFQVVK
jgi:hypothetical protein